MDIMAETENRTLQDKFMLRLPDGMRDRIRVAAEANNRSMNAEIVARLEGSLELEATLDAKLGRLERREQRLEKVGAQLEERAQKLEERQAQLAELTAVLQTIKAQLEAARSKE